MNRLLLAAAVASVVGCSQARFYTGDGRFTDNGFMAYSRRFVIDLGPVDLSKPGTYAYTLSGLPHAEVVASVQVTEEDQNTLHTKRDYPAVVRMQLQTEQNQIVIDEKASLNSWVRSFGVLGNVSELYRREEESEAARSRSGKGRGTYFYSERGETYRLRFEVFESSMNRPARIVLVGWSR